MKPDALSGWATAPAAARLAGDWPAFRCFATAGEAMRFLAGEARNAAKQKRYRQRQRENALVLRGVALPCQVVSMLIDSGRLPADAANDPKQIERAAVAVLIEWSQQWGGAFSVTR